MMILSAEDYQSDVFLQLKRKIYLGIIPLVLIAFTLLWIDSNLNQVDQWAIPILALLLLIDFIILISFFPLIRFFELLILVVFSLYHVMKFFIFTHIIHEPDFYMLWSPLYFIFIFIALHTQKGFIYSLFIYIITVIMWVSHNDFHKMNLINQLFISNICYIIVLYYFQRIFSIFAESEMLKRFAYEDSLTSIGNRRMLDFWINNEITKTKEQHTTFSIIYFDIDHFKRINDTFGHETGDLVLQELVSIVNNNIRTGDYFGRWGGEEFLVIVKNQDATQTEQLADRLRSIIANHNFATVGTVTTSFGITTYKENDTIQTILRRADKALYTAKENGRNKVDVN
jgi:diguanylate cyclase (GGDEF)-like protein